MVDPIGTGGGGPGSSSSSGSTGTGTGAGTGTGTGGTNGLIEQRCPDVAAELHHCVSLGFNNLTLVGPDTGNTCKLTDALLSSSSG